MMTLCPIALAAGCKKCPAVSFCLLKTVVGDYEGKEKEEAQGEKHKQNRD